MLTGFKKCYYKNRERLVQQQRATRDAVKDTPEFKLQKKIYNDRCRGKSAASACMLEYYKRNEERIAETRKRLRARLTVEKERTRLQLLKTVWTGFGPKGLGCRHPGCAGPWGRKQGF